MCLIYNRCVWIYKHSSCDERRTPKRPKDDRKLIHEIYAVAVCCVCVRKVPVTCCAWMRSPHWHSPNRFRAPWESAVTSSVFRFLFRSETQVTMSDPSYQGAEWYIIYDHNHFLGKPGYSCKERKWILMHKLTVECWGI